MKNENFENHDSMGDKTKTGGEKCKSSKGKLVHTAHIHMNAFISYSWTRYSYSCHTH